MNQEKEGRVGRVFQVDWRDCVKALLESTLAGEEIKEVMTRIIVILDKGIIAKLGLGKSWVSLKLAKNEDYWDPLMRS